MARTKIKAGNPTARILIVDDHPAIREALAIRIAAEADLEVCGEASDYAEAVRLADETNPDVAIIDLALKSANGLDLIKKFKTKHKKLRTIVWSMYSENLYAERALRAGARGYINKEHATVKIIEAIRQVLEGKVYLSDAITEKLLARHVGPSLPNASLPPLDALSDRELDVFRLIGQGIKTTDIAEQLNLSAKTIETYRDRIRKKLDLKDSIDLANIATQWFLENQ